MGRDYKKESKKRKEKSKRFVAEIEKDLAEEFLEALEKDNNKEYSTWLRNNIKKYLKKDWKSVDIRVHVCYCNYRKR